LKWELAGEINYKCGRQCTKKC